MPQPIWKNIASDVHTESCDFDDTVTLTHLPTLLAVTVDTKGSKHENLLKAQEQLVVKLHEKGWFN